MLYFDTSFLAPLILRKNGGRPYFARGIEHRPTRTKHPQIISMVERFNGRIADLLRTQHFCSGEELEATLLRYAWL